MSSVIIYTRPWCGYCGRARRLLEQAGLSFEEVNLDEQPERELEMIRRSNGRMTVPQIFLGQVHVGGSSELGELVRQGKLKNLLPPEREQTGGA